MMRYVISDCFLLQTFEHVSDVFSHQTAILLQTLVHVLKLVGKGALNDLPLGLEGGCEQTILNAEQFGMEADVLDLFKGVQTCRLTNCLEIRKNSSLHSLKKSNRHMH